MVRENITAAITTINVDDAFDRLALGKIIIIITHAVVVMLNI
jgi:hypothetical protein